MPAIQKLFERTETTNPNPSPIGEKFGFVRNGGVSKGKGELVQVGRTFGLLIML